MEEEKNIDKKEKKKSVDGGLYSTKKEPRKSLSIYLKNQNRLIMNSVAIADRKAAILIRVNTAIVSALIVFESYFKTNMNLGDFIIPVLIIGLSISLFCALLAAKPFSYSMYKVFRKVIKRKYPNLEDNNFMMFEHADFEDYEISMKKVINSQDLQLGNLTRFNYFMSKSISKIFFLLEIAYGFFMITFVVVGVLYVASLF